MDVSLIVRVLMNALSDCSKQYLVLFLFLGSSVDYLLILNVKIVNHTEKLSKVFGLINRFICHFQLLTKLAL